MIFNRPFLHALGIASLMAGCSTAPLVIDSTHPASIDAPEASSKRIPNSLAPDTATRRTQTLLAERERQAKAAESAAPADQSDLTTNAPPSASAPSSTPSSEGNSHSNMHHD
jgi:hypothetical protein